MYETNLEERDVGAAPRVSGRAEYEQQMRETTARELQKLRQRLRRPEMTAAYGALLSDRGKAEVRPRRGLGRRGALGPIDECGSGI
jgi:hypothetical protein